MSDAEKDDSKVDTVPPPSGEDDAYNAPTRVGPVDQAVLEAMMASGHKPAEAPPPVAEATFAARKTPPPVPRRPAPAPLPPPVEETTAKPVDPPIEQRAPVALPSEAPRPAAPPAVVFLPLVVGLVIFVVGLALYFWAS